jgi:hypothetical protein
MHRLFGVLALAILAAACGGSGKGTIKPGLGDGGTTYTPVTTTQQFIDQIISAECDLYVRCDYLPDKPTCVEYFGSITSPDMSSLAYSIDQGRTTINTSTKDACLQGLASLPCILSSSNFSSLDSSCGTLLVGTIASGGDCVDDSECKPGFECDKGSCTASCCPGVCVTIKPQAAVGGACTGNSTCVDTAYCKQTYNSTTGMVDGICQARVATGALCTDAGSCGSNAQCVGSTGSKTCVALAKDGADCGSSGVYCENNASYCDPVKGTCQPRLKDGASCTVPDAGMTASYSAGCLSFSQCKYGVCTRLPGLGQACSNPDAAMLDECMMVGKCVDGVCQADPPQPVCTVAVAKAAVADAGARD